MSADAVANTSLWPSIRGMVWSRTGRTLLQATFLSAALFPPSALAVEQFEGRVVSVTDGDTLWVQPVAGGGARKLRIEGIDAPEICQAGGEASRAALSRRVKLQKVRVTVTRVDEHGRGLASLRFNGLDVGADMVRQGQAWSYRWRRNPGPYAAEEHLARQAGRGVFADPMAERPRDFRRSHGPCDHLQRQNR